MTNKKRTLSGHRCESSNIRYACIQCVMCLRYVQNRRGHMVSIHDQTQHNQTKLFENVDFFSFRNVLLQHCSCTPIS